MSETKQPTNFKYEWETNQIIKIDYIKRRSLYHPRLTYIQNSGDITYCTEDEKDIKCDVLISRQAQEIKRLRKENEENEKNLINEEQHHMSALREIDRLERELTSYVPVTRFIKLELENKRLDEVIFGLKLELTAYKRNKKTKKKKKNSLYMYQEQELERQTYNLNKRLKNLENDNKKLKNEIKQLREAGHKIESNINTIYPIKKEPNVKTIYPVKLEMECMADKSGYIIEDFVAPQLNKDLEKGKAGEIHELRLSKTTLFHMQHINIVSDKEGRIEYRKNNNNEFYDFSGFMISGSYYIILTAERLHLIIGGMGDLLEEYNKNSKLLNKCLNLDKKNKKLERINKDYEINKNKLEQTNKELLNKINEHKTNNKKTRKDINELSKELTKSYIEVEDLKQQIKTNKDYKEYKDNFEKLQTQSGKQLKNVINDYEKDLKILRMRIKNQDNTLNTQGTRLKELANMKNQYSKYIDKYNRIDKYIDNTIYRITGIKRDFKKGIHNNINSLNQLRNIDEIIKQDLNITKSEFNNYFKNIKNLRLQQAHEDISHITSQDLINMILEDMIF